MYIMLGSGLSHRPMYLTGDVCSRTLYRNPVSGSCPVATMSFPKNLAIQAIRVAWLEKNMG